MKRLLYIIGVIFIALAVACFYVAAWATGDLRGSCGITGLLNVIVGIVLMGTMDEPKKEGT